MDVVRYWLRMFLSASVIDCNQKISCHWEVCVCEGVHSCTYMCTCLQMWMCVFTCIYMQLCFHTCLHSAFIPFLHFCEYSKREEIHNLLCLPASVFLSSTSTTTLQYVPFIVFRSCEYWADLVFSLLLYISSFHACIFDFLFNSKGRQLNLTFVF